MPADEVPPSPAHPSASNTETNPSSPWARKSRVFIFRHDIEGTNRQPGAYHLVVTTPQPAHQQALRLWPGVAAVALQWLLRFGVPQVLPDEIIIALAGGALGGLAVILWWMFYSRAPWLDRIGIIALTILAAAVTFRLLDKSVATAMMGMMFPFSSVPFLSLAIVASAVLARHFSNGARRAVMIGAILLTCLGWTLVRTNGITGDAASDFAWRWSKTKEERLVALQPAAPPVPLPPAAVSKEEPVAKTEDKPAVIVAATANWSGFRGPHRDGIVSGIQINTDWSLNPPVELWRKPVGPGWSSFAVQGDLIYTQEQRGEDEMVTCYSATTGNPVWAHRDAARFWEANAGAGPRGTPTLHNGNVYTLGATGILNALNANTGAVQWTRNAATDTGAKQPGWAFASSPLVLDDMVIVATSGQLAAYDLATGAPRWTGPAGGDSYSSPQLATLGGVVQILLASEIGLTSLAPADGKLLWKYEWPSGTRIMQPAVTADGEILVTNGDGMSGIGIRRIAVIHSDAGWTTEERWTSPGLKPNFNDFVIHDGHVYGFDNSILACIDLKDGKRLWKGGRYGHGQFVLLRDQGLMIVLSEEGGLALVKADATQFTELAKFPAMEGKTWNHPVLAGDRLFVRNGSEMVAFRLALLSSPTAAPPRQSPAVPSAP